MVLVPLFVLSGCSGDTPVYVAGPEEEIPAMDSAGADSREGSRGDEAAPSLQESEAPELRETQASPDDNGVESAGFVYVCGSVVNPGVYPMDPGMRVFEAVALAGGFRPEADEQWLNQAQPVQDGQRLYVYSKEEVARMEQEGITAGEAGGDGPVQPGEHTSVLQNTAGEANDNDKININTADQAALMTLPGIGEAKAKAVIQYRSEHGNFTSIEEIQNISGIKTAVFSKIKDLITV